MLGIFYQEELLRKAAQSREKTPNSNFGKKFSTSNFGRNYHSYCVNLLGKRF